MNVAATGQTNYSYFNSQIGAQKTSTPAKQSNIPGDTVSISQACRALSTRSANLQSMESPTIRMHTMDTKLSAGALRWTNRAWNGEQTADEAATGLKYYTKPGRMNSEMDAALDNESSSLARRIDIALKKAGIELTDKDKLKFNVGKDGTIKIDAQGLTAANRAKAGEIENALNSDAGLAKSLYMNSASKVLHNAGKALANNPMNSLAMFQVGNSDPNVAAAQRATVDDWLRSTLGFGIDDLESERYGNHEGGDVGQYEKQLDEYGFNELSFNDAADLRVTIHQCIANSKKAEAKDFEASFTYQNGTLTDSRDANAAAKAETSQSATIADKLNLAL